MDSGMQIDPGDGTGAVDEIDDICGSDNVSYPKEAKIRRLNFARDQFYSLALGYDKHWLIDDRNKFDENGDVRQLQIATCRIRAGQQDYPFALELLTINGVFAKDPTGVFHELEEATNENIFLETSSGTPTQYKIIGNSILLGPTPNYEIEGGLKIPFNRNGRRYQIDDTDVLLGVPSLFEEWMCQVAALPYLIKNRLPNKNDIAALIAAKKDPTKADSIPYFIANRNRKKKTGLRPAMESNK